MTNEEKELLVTYVADNGEPCLTATSWTSSWTGTRSERKQCPERRITRRSCSPSGCGARSFEDGRRAGLSKGAAKLGWDKLDNM